MTSRSENTIYIRLVKHCPTPVLCGIAGYPEKKCREHGLGAGDYMWEAFAKAQGEGSIVGGVTREDAIRAAGQILWAIERFGPDGWRVMAPIDALPGIPVKFDYLVIDEERV